MGVWLQSFVYRYLVILESFVKETIVSLTERSWHLCWKLVDYRCMRLCLDSQFYPIDLHVYSYTINPLIWLLWLCKKSWNLIMWVFQLHFSFSRLFWLFCVPYNSTWTLGFTFQFLDRIALSLSTILSSIAILTKVLKSMNTWCLYIYWNF